MKKILLALSIGAIAGIIDTVPMIIQGLNWYANLSAFIHWLVLGLIIPFVKWDIKSWLKGFIIAELSAIPIVIIVSEGDLASVIPILLFSAVLGVFIGITGDKFIKNN